MIATDRIDAARREIEALRASMEDRFDVHDALDVALLQQSVERLGHTLREHDGWCDWGEIWPAALEAFVQTVARKRLQWYCEVRRALNSATADASGVRVLPL